MVPPSGNDPEPLAFRASAQTFYATTAETGAAGGDRTQPFRFTTAALEIADSRLSQGSIIYNLQSAICVVAVAGLEPAISSLWGW